MAYVDDLPYPMSKEEIYLNAIATGDADDLPYPMSKVEQFLYFIAINGGGGGGGSYILPTATPLVKGGIKVGDTLTINNAVLDIKSFHHNQSVSSKTWSIQHNLDSPYWSLSIFIVDSDGNTTNGNIDKSLSTNNLLVIKFTESISGEAYIKK